MQPRPFRVVPSLVLLLTLALPGFAWAAGRSAPLAEAPAHLAKAAAVAEPPARIAAGVEPLARLIEADRGAADQLEALAAWNRAGRTPLQTGILRPMPLPRTVRFGDRLAGEPAGLHAGGAFARVGPGSTVWGASVEVAGSHRLRLHLDGVDLPAGTRMWVYGDDGEAVSFGPELAHEGSLWTPSVYGPAIRLEVELPGEALGASPASGFVVDRVAEIFRLGPDGAPITAPWTAPRAHDGCLIDVSCVTPGTFSVVDQAERAIAHIEFIDGSFQFVCTGGLLNLAQGAPAGLEPPFLTANHCLDTQAAAATLEAFWDFKTASCDGSPPSLMTVPRTNGANLLASNPISDFTLVDVDFPANRVLLGWNGEIGVLPKDTVTHRISHPVPHSNSIMSQRYTRNRTKGAGEILHCGTDDEGRATDNLSRFIHSVFLEGGTFGGSSGAPLILDNGQVVGQLLGACGDPETVNDGCSKENDEIDGNFFTTFDFIKEHLGAAQSDGVLTTPEIPGFEFEVTITAGGSPVQGASEADCIVETLCVSGALPGRPEVFVKIIGPRPNGFLWVQISRFTPSRVDVTVRQLSTGQENQYTLQAVGPGVDDVSGHQDRGAFTP